MKQEEGWVVCRVFKKRVTTMRKVSEHDSPCWYDDQAVSFIQDLDSPKQTSQSNLVYNLPSYPCKKELDLPYQLPRDHFLQLPLLESPKLLHSVSSSITPNPIPPYLLDHVNHSTSLLPPSLMQEDQHIGHQNFQDTTFGNNSSNSNEQALDQVTDWRVLDKFVASQLSQDASKDNTYSNTTPNIFQGTDSGNCNVQFRHLDKQVVPEENASTSNSSCPIDLWK